MRQQKERMDCFAALAMTIHTFPRHRPRKRATQYPETLVMESRSSGVLDAPLARGMTAFCGAALCITLPVVIARLSSPGDDDPRMGNSPMPVESASCAAFEQHLEIRAHAL